MAHLIEFNKLRGKSSFFGVKEPAWHGLGQIVEKALTSKEAIIEANLDYIVEKGKMYGKYINLINNEKGIEIPNTFFTYRTDTGLPLTKNGTALTGRYTIVQNVEAFDFFDSIVEEGAAMFHTAGVLGNGERIFISAKLPDDILVDKDKINQYLLLTMAHDGTGSIQVLFTPVRVVCNNTLNAALSTKTRKIFIKHTASAKDKLEQSKELLGIMPTIRHKTQDIYCQMYERSVNDLEIAQYISSVFLNEEEYKIENNKLYIEDTVSTRKLNNLSDIVKYYEGGAGQGENTLYHLYNSFTGYIQNVKYKDDKKETKFDNIFFGSDRNLMEKSYNKALQLI